MAVMRMGVNLRHPSSGDGILALAVLVADGTLDALHLPMPHNHAMQYEKAFARGKHHGSVFGFFCDNIQEVCTSLDEYMANWFVLDQSNQWELNNYYEDASKYFD